MGGERSRAPWLTVLLWGPLVGLAVFLLFVLGLQPIAREIWTGPDEGLQNESLNEVILWMVLGLSALAGAGFTHIRCRSQGVPQTPAVVLAVVSIGVGVGFGFLLVLLTLGVACHDSTNCLG